MAELFQLQIITPERVFYKGDVTFVELKTTEGKVGIYKNHVPMTMLLSPGILTIHNEQGERKAALHTGFVEVLQDKVSVLAEIAEWPEEIDLNRAEEARIRAERRIKSEDSNSNLVQAEMALRKALVRIEVAKK
ncbi:MAG: ATP synthase F1 subunit epsilon [Lachnospiraceae bacterium]